MKRRIRVECVPGSSGTKEARLEQIEAGLFSNEVRVTGKEIRQLEGLLA